ncbi:tRNA (uracil-O(2)-)-methyltransferase [Exophiala dermatitidis]
MTLKSEAGHWCTGSEYQQDCPWLTGDKFMQVTDLLLENPNLNSTHLFRADILYDSAGILQTVHDRERQCGFTNGESESLDAESAHEHEVVQVDVGVDIDAQAPKLEGAVLKRRVLRRLIPRKPQLDRALDQWCYIYHRHQRLAESGAGDEAQKRHSAATVRSDMIVVYVPLVDSEADMPWYHPPVQALAYLYEHTSPGTDNNATARLSVHFLPFKSSRANKNPTGPTTTTTTTTDALPPRLHRTIISLLRTFLRLAKNPAPEKHGPISEPDGNVSVSIPLSAVDASLAPSALKDTILPQHVVQNTYTRLKQEYAPDLISRWVESTEPSKHVFEDLSIAAFVIELWKQMYPESTKFPGFVDLACGNGVLTYILVKEGYRGRGFDARRRKTWQVLGIDEFLDEMICVPEPFLEQYNYYNTAATNTNDNVNDSDRTAAVDNLLSNTKVHNGIFEPGTFIISNHADELTPWTPLLAALSDPQNPLPFLSIPCCSHALSGAKHRYWPSEIRPGPSTQLPNDGDAEPQPETGDLKALRAAKVKAANHTDDKSMYACLTRKTVALAEEVGFQVELTLMRLPSTRNIGIVGNRRRAAAATTPTPSSSSETSNSNANALRSKISALLERECAMSGGVGEAAKTWIERAQKLQGGVGRGKVNLRGQPQPAAVD